MTKLIATLLLLCMSIPAGVRTTQSASDTVYVCTGPKAKRYHKHSDCRGLEKYSGTVKAISKSQAISSSFTPCKICY